MENLTFILLIALLMMILIMLIILVVKVANLQTNMRRELKEYEKDSTQTSTMNMKSVADVIATSLQSSLKGLQGQLEILEKRLSGFSSENELKMENMRSTIEKRLTYIQEDNNSKLDDMRKVVEEKLDDKMNKSFQLVNERLEAVYKGLGEMQTLANGVGDLKKVLSNVKTRGILGEIQLGSILSEILSPDQYDTNVATVPNSTERVEFAVKIPTENGSSIYLPIDSKFPGVKYEKYRDAVDSGNVSAAKEALKELLTSVKSSAKDICEKYLEPPYTTEFGIMFLPFEGLYAEVVDNGMVEILQREYHVNIAGPSTMAAMLNSLQMGFKSMAIQKRSGEVWKVLGSVKTEFDKFAEVLSATQKRLGDASEELDRLVGTRTRAMQKQLNNVTMLTEEQSPAKLPEK